MNKTIKILSVLLIAITIIMTGSTSVMAADKDDSKSGTTTIIDGIQPDYTNTGSITTVGQKITSIISTVGVVVAVVVLLVLGIKYMMGSASEKAEYKKTMIPYLVGAVLIFGASAIAKVVIGMAETIKV